MEAGILHPYDAERKYVCMEGKAFREACGGLKKLSAEGELLREEIVNKDVFK